MYKVTLIKGKSFSIRGYIFNSDDDNFKSRIIPDDMLYLFANNSKFKIEEIGNGNGKEHKKEMDITYNPDIFILGHYISLEDGYGTLLNELLDNYDGYVEQNRNGVENKNKAIIQNKDTTIIQVTAPYLFKHNECKKNIGFTMFETTKIPDTWADKCNYSCDELIVPAEEVKKVFKDAGVTIPIHVCPLWVNDKYKPLNNKHGKSFKFLFVGQVEGYNRKGWYELVKAFKAEFKNDKDVELIIKCPKLSISSVMVRDILSDDRIKIIKEVYSEEQMLELYNSVDCFVYPTHGEGFGLPPLEAMACGLPTIVTDFMGCSEFIDDRYCYPLKVTELEEAMYAPDYGDVGKWAKIDIKVLRKLMRNVYERPESALSIGKGAARYINRNYRFKHFKEKFEEIINGKKKDNIVFFAHHISQSEGYGCFCWDLMKNGYKMTLEEVRDGLTDLKNLKKENVSPDNYVIQICAGDLFKKYNKYKKNIGYTMFETTKLPKHWAGIINGACDEVMVPAHEVKDVFIRCGVTKPIHVVPLWVNDVYQYFSRPKRKEFKFLWTGKLDKFNRKGWKDAIQAFDEEFRQDENVKLIIKTARIIMHDNERKELFNWIKDMNVEINEGTYTNEELYQVYKDVDCFIFPTHGEGFGLTPLEAMATGLPTIVSNWMGCQEFVNPKYCYPININELEEAHYPALYGDIGWWANIDIKDVRKKMRYVYENQDKARKVGDKAAEYVNSKFRLKHFDMNLKKALGIYSDQEEDNVSIVLAIKDNLKYLEQCIDSIYKFTEVDFELILVDNGSSNIVKKYLKQIKKSHNNIIVITNKENMGYAYACNQGIKRANGKYICMLDIDTIVSPGWLEEMTAAMKKDNRAGVVVPSQSYLESMIYAPFKRNENIPIQEDVANFSKTLKKGEFIEKGHDTIYGFCHLVKREVYEDIGGYDYKRYKGASMNETDLFWRAFQKGYKLYWAKGAFVYHYHSVVKKSLGLDDNEMYNKGQKIFRDRQDLDVYVKNDSRIGALL